MLAEALPFGCFRSASSHRSGSVVRLRGMRPASRPGIALVAAASLGLLALAMFLSRECAYGGGMAGWYRDCEPQ